MIPQFQLLVMNLLLLAIQEIKIPTHPTLRMIQNQRIMILLESYASVGRMDVYNVISITTMKLTNMYINLIYMRIMSNKIQKILEPIGP